MTLEAFMFFKKNTSSHVDPNDEHRDFKLMESVVVDAFEEQKKSRRWGIFFKSLTFLYLFVGILVFYPVINGGVERSSAKKDHTAVIRIDGPIASNESASAANINSGLRRAFKNDHAKAIILAINSPGGSPVQSAYVYDEIYRLRDEYPDKKVYAVIEEIGASGAYYIASAADEIYANRSSLVGSIGVTASGFGFVDTIKKLGVERRHFTAGEHKAFLDPFSPVKEDEKLFWEQVLKSTHVQFIDAVKKGRGERLTITDDITSGLVWNGEQALTNGLIDGLGSARNIARDIIGEEELVGYSQKKSPIAELMKNFGVSVGEGVGHFLMKNNVELTY